MTAADIATDQGDALHSAAWPLVVAAAIDLADLGEQIGALARALRSVDGNAQALAVEVLAERVVVLSNALCSIDLEEPPREVAQRIFPHAPHLVQR